MELKKYFILPQWIAGIGVTLLMYQLGILSGWASPALARLTEPDSEIPLNLDQASWVASLLNFSRFFGSILGAVASTYLGSKKSVFATAVPIAIGWLTIALANRVEWLYVARLSGGLGLGMSYSSFPLYVGEVSMPEIRGALISLATCGTPIGLLAASIAGSYLSLNMSAYIYLAFAVALLLLFVWLPESPHHLIAIGKREAAKKSIEYYRNGKGVEKELEEVELFVASNRSCSVVDKFKEFKKPAIRSATFQAMALFAFFQTCGVNAVIPYMELILKEAGFKMADPSLIVIYVNVGGTVASIVASFLIDTFGRRFLLLASSIIVVISMVGLTYHFLLIENNQSVEQLQWLPMCSMFFFVIGYYLGLMPVPSAVLSEMFPANIKCIAACIAGLTAAILSFVTAKTYQPIVDAVGHSYTFIIYGALTFLAIPYTIFIMPETKGKSLQQIQDELIKRK